MPGPRGTPRSVALAILKFAVVACGSEPLSSPTTPTSTRQACAVATSLCAARIEVTPGRFVRSYQSYSLGAGDSLVTQAVVVVHGTDRNADDYFATMMDAVRLANRVPSTIVLAPRFITADDSPASDEPVWTSSGWRQGDLSSSTGPLPRISAYAVVDSIVAALGNRARFPRLTRVTIAGHSAGAQLVHRLAATSRTATLNTGIAVQFVAANPSTWLYLGPERANGRAFTVPASRTDCADYDDWHYGLQNRNTYANAPSMAAVRQNLTQRDVTVLLGTADTLTADLDVSCGANLQGARRYSRGLTLMDYMNTVYPGHAHKLVTVTGVGHSNGGMFTSANGRRALFPE
ncbi:MAG: alpha/beta hydrolase [Gemmatimonas sp.]|nr:alpha/beta hydrolase [Gemmatimonas sp.]